MECGKRVKDPILILGCGANTTCTPGSRIYTERTDDPRYLVLRNIKGKHDHSKVFRKKRIG